MAWYDDILKPAGVAVATIGLITASVTGAWGYLNIGPSTEVKKYEIQQTASLERMKVEYHLREIACANAYAYLEDDKPNTALDPEQRAASTELLKRNVQACDVPRLPSPSTEVALPKQLQQVTVPQEIKP